MIGKTVQVHDDHFLPNDKDEDWLLEVGKRGWIVLTKDDRIRYRVTERTAILSAKVRAQIGFSVHKIVKDKNLNRGRILSRISLAS